MALAGCGGGDGGEKFVGTWHRPEFPDERMIVTRVDAKRLSFVRHGDGLSKTSVGEPNIGDVVDDRVVFSAVRTAVLLPSGNMVYGTREYTK